METRSRLRRASEVRALFDTSTYAENFDDVESETEQEDHVETQLDEESDENMEFDDDLGRRDEAASERTSRSRVSTQIVEPPNKRRRGRQSYLRGKNGYK